MKFYDEDSQNWKFGVFYFNKNDERIFVPKRIGGLGWTINFANPLSVLVGVTILIILLASTLSR